jgi:hypothetical protein
MKNFEDFQEEALQELEESSLSRLHSKHQKGGMGYMSAERGDKSKKENKARTKQLAKDIRGAGLPGPTKVEGQYKEAGQDKPNKEASYGVSSGKKGKKAFKKAMKKLGKKYDQDSVLIQKDKKSDAKLHATTPAGKKDLGKWDGKVGKMKPGGKGDMQTRIKGKTFTMEEVVNENYGDNTNDPKKLEKELPKGYKYSAPRQGKGDHKTANLEVNGTSTDINIGGAAKGKSGSYSPSWKAEHNKAKKTLRGIDNAVKEVQQSKAKTSDTAKRMAKGYASKVKTDATKAISDLTGRGRKTNVQGKGNKALKRAGLREFAESLGMDTEVHPVDADRRGVDAAIENGYDAVDAHQSIAGETTLNDPKSLSKLAATMGRVQKDGGTNAPVTDKDAKSLYAQERAAEKGKEQQFEEARPIYGRGGEQRRTQTPRQIGVTNAPHNIPKGGTTISARDPQGKRLLTGDQDRGKGNKAARRAAALKPKEKRFPNRLKRSDGQGIQDSYDYYDITLSQLRAAEKETK